MTARGYERGFVRILFRTDPGFGSYGFPESHAASFALLVYVSAWIKKHHPAAFAAALLNSQPMGFYAPAEIVRCARDHGSHGAGAGCVFQRLGLHPGAQRNAAHSCLRLGFRQIDGFKEDDAPYHHATSAAMAIAALPISSAAPRLPKRALVTLAEADAFRSFGLDRREGLWAVRRLPDDDPLPLFAPRAAPEQGAENIAPLPLMPLSEHVVADYQTTRLSLKGYPTQFLRPRFDAEGITPCGGLKDLKDGAAVRCRRRGAGAPAARATARPVSSPSATKPASPMW